MPDTRAPTSTEEFRALRQALVRGGVAPARVTRTLAELKDHFEDLRCEAMACGCAPEEAAADAMRRLGSSAVLAREVLRHREFQSWAFRWPWVPALLRQFVILTSLAAVPVLVVVSRGPVIARWCVSTGLATLVTGGLLLLLARVLIGRLPV